MALIIANATPNSLIIIDELGRGTSNQDGVGIAWACCENLISLRAPTLFATHFSELVQLANIYPNCQNLHLGVEPRQDGLHFLYRCHVCARTRASAALARALARASLARSLAAVLSDAHAVRSVQKGVAEECSYGMYAAESAAFPREVIDEARRIRGILAANKSRISGCISLQAFLECSHFCGDKPAGCSLLASVNI